MSEQRIFFLESLSCARFWYRSSMRREKKEIEGGWKGGFFNTIKKLRPLSGDKIDQPRDATLVPDRIVRILTMADLWCPERAKKKDDTVRKVGRNREIFSYTIPIENWRPATWNFLSFSLVDEIAGIIDVTVHYKVPFRPFPRCEHRAV